MDDIIKKSDIRELELQGRVGLYVYCTSYKNVRQLNHYGDVGFSSHKGHYTLLYVDEDKADSTLRELEKLKFVKEVRKGHLKELSENFSEAFVQTNLEVKQELEEA